MYIYRLTSHLLELSILNYVITRYFASSSPADVLCHNLCLLLAQRRNIQRLEIGNVSVALVQKWCLNLRKTDPDFFCRWRKNSLTDKTWFWIYFCWGYGVPLLLVFVTVLVDNLPGDHLRPRFGEVKCWFKGELKSKEAGTGWPFC